MRFRVAPLFSVLAAGDDPPLGPGGYLHRLRGAGATELYVAVRTEAGVLIETTSEERARAGAVLMARSRRVLASSDIDWGAGKTPIGDALARVTCYLQGYDRIGRFRFAATDMRLAASAAEGLILAENEPGVRVYERVIETGMVITYARPYMESNDAPVGRKWWPKGRADLELHEELIDLRNEYHAHAGHEPHRRLEVMTGFARLPARPTLHESWARLTVTKLEALRDLATRQADRFDAEAERLDLDLLGPRS